MCAAKATGIREQLGAANGRGEESRQQNDRCIERGDRVANGGEPAKVGRASGQHGRNRLPKRVVAYREEGRGRRGRLRLRWENCVKRDVRNAGIEGNWRGKAQDRREWRKIVQKVTEKPPPPPLAPDKGMHEEEDEVIPDAMMPFANPSA